MTPQTLSAAVGCGMLRASLYAAPLALSMARWGIATGEHQAGLLGQLAVESARLSVLEENLNYSAERLCAVWPRRFPTLASAAPYARNPEQLANKTYGGRNGNTQPGDGWAFRGRGLIQLTGRANYQAYADAAGNPGLMLRPERVLQPEVAVDTACWFFASRGCLAPAQRSDWTAVSRIVNGGTHALAERIAASNRALAVLAVI